MKILITGVGGFIGNKLVKSLKKENNFLIGIARSPIENDIKLDELIFKELTPKTDLSKYLIDVDIVIHLAAKVHFHSKSNVKDINSYIKENFLVTKNLIHQALYSNVKRFVFLSSVGVYGSSSKKPFTEEDEVKPDSSYSKSKVMCENYIRDFCRGTKLSFTIIRSPLVYGIDAPGNLGILKKFIDLKIPLPILSLDRNKRSIISISKLVEFIKICIEQEKSINQTFLVSDGNDRSTLEIINLFCEISNLKLRAFKCPTFLLIVFFKIIGRDDLKKKLINSFQINIDKSMRLLNYDP